MGCHTWLYEKVDNVPSDEILLQYTYKETFEEIKNGKYIKKSHYDLRYNEDWMKETKYKNSLSDPSQKVIDLNKVPEILRNLFTKEDQFFIDPDYDLRLIQDSTGTYKELPYGDIFRISGYPEEYLHSYKECEDFINSPKVVEDLPEGYDKFEGDYEDDPDKVLYTLSYRSEGQTKKSVLDVCKKFFDEHPNGLIRFG